MANRIRQVAILILVFLVIVAVLQFVMSPAHSKSSVTIRSKGMKGWELAKVQKKDQAAATAYLNDLLERTLPKDSRYQRHGTVGKSENGESRTLSFREREMERKLFHSKRQIPGGPDSQHHRCRRKRRVKKKCT